MSAKIVYNPADTGEPEDIEIFGQKFRAGKVVTVSDDLAIRLMGNPMFERKDKPADDGDKPAADPPSPITQPPLRTPEQAAMGQGDPPVTQPAK